MAENTHKIGWLNVPGYKGETWNPIIGCSKCSPGCQHCYAERMAFRQTQMRAGCEYCDVVDPVTHGWNGKTAFVESALEKPLHWKSPRVIFVCSMSDVFHESVPFEWVDRIFDKAVLTPQHKYLLLTKRPERMAEYHISRNEYGIAENVGIGVTVCNQAEADAKIPVLLSISAAMRFVSIEPMLGEIDLDFGENMEDYEDSGVGMTPCGVGGIWHQHPLFNGRCRRNLDWVIVGGESGHNARPLHPDWVRKIQRQCEDASVPFFFKQWGEYYPVGNWKDGVLYDFVGMERIGKTAAGHLLDGKEYRQYPQWVGRI